MLSIELAKTRGRITQLCQYYVNNIMRMANLT